MPSRPPFVSVLALSLLLAPSFALAQGSQYDTDKFRQLEEILPTPNAFRTASGAPGPGYWQQQADYVIHVELDDDRQRIRGTETVHYVNNSPETLRYLWLQLDNNIFDPEGAAALGSLAPRFEPKGSDVPTLPYRTLARVLRQREFDGSLDVTRVADAAGNPLDHTIVGTVMRIELPEPLAPGGTFDFACDWNYAINDAVTIRARTGYEFFEEDGNYIYEIAHWYPRLVSYTDVNGWHHKQFIGRGEFTLEMGNFEVHITAPADHVVAATGVLQNPDAVLTETQRNRLTEAETAGRPVFVVTPGEAERNESSRARETKTWIYKADRVRDVAFASSRKFIWDAQLHDQGGNRVWAMSYYPNEAEPLWSTYSTHAVIHTLEVYSRYTFHYPYPVAISVNGPVGGMEYPMICFNGPRTEDDGTYFDVSQGKDGNFWNRTKYGLISVIIHEVGHNYFPMIVNSDERQWTWMDEGLNSFLQFLAEQEWEDGYPSRRGEPKNIVEYMRSKDQVPIMTNSESLRQFGNNAYGKPATALNILRESILGRELFDYAFREYAQRWMFKRPMPADFFRTMEDASGVDLDWFWRGWFYSTAPCDIAIEGVRHYELDTRDPDVELPLARETEEDEVLTLSAARNENAPKRVDAFPELKDFYNSYDEYEVTPQAREDYRELIEELETWERDLLGTSLNLYVLDFVNEGGLVMPVILEVEYDDASVEELRLPAEIWRQSAERASKLIVTDKEIVRVLVDPHLETADIDLENNRWPAEPVKTRFQLYKATKPKNPMQEAREREGRP